MEELKVRYANVKSFYGKAHIIRDSEGIKLLSYSTVIAEFREGRPYIYGWYSSTSTRHLKEFLQQMGFPAGSKRELVKMYNW